jgi:hypothetical protein
MPDTMPPAEAGIGHNNPPPDMAVLRERLADVDPKDLARLAIELIVERLPVLTAELDAAIAEHLGVLTKYDEERPELLTEEHAARAANFIKRMQETRKTIEEAFKPAKAPFLSGSRAVDAHFNALRDKLGKAIDSIQGRLDRYYKKLEQKRREEEASLAREREAAEAKLREAAQAEDGAAVQQAAERAAELERAQKTAAAPARVRSDHGALLTGKVKYSIVITDKALVPEDYKVVDEKKVRTVLEAAHKANAPIEIPGVKLVVERTAQVR